MELPPGPRAPAVWQTIAWMTRPGAFLRRVHAQFGEPATIRTYWTEEPMVRLYGHSWETRWGTAGERKMVKVYSNCPSAELFVGGVSQGVRQRQAPSMAIPALGHPGQELDWLVGQSWSLV